MRGVRRDARVCIASCTWYTRMRGGDRCKEGKLGCSTHAFDRKTELPTFFLRPPSSSSASPAAKSDALRIVGLMVPSSPIFTRPKTCVNPGCTPSADEDERITLSAEDEDEAFEAVIRCWCWRALSSASRSLRRSFSILHSRNVLSLEKSVNHKTVKGYTYKCSTYAAILRLGYGFAMKKK